jgi:hypothetical protein
MTDDIPPRPPSGQASPTTSASPTITPARPPLINPKFNQTQLKLQPKLKQTQPNVKENLTGTKLQYVEWIGFIYWFTLITKESKLKLI